MLNQNGLHLEASVQEEDGFHLNFMFFMMSTVYKN